MKGYVLSPAAQADLSQIWDYSARNWGAEQADRYILAIRDACEALADGSRRGRAVDDIRPGYRKLAVASHFLFYRITDAAYERRSLAVTSNIHPSGFDTIMPKTLATATVDRLMHHAHVCQTAGDSIRLSQALAGKGVMPLSS